MARKEYLSGTVPEIGITTRGVCRKITGGTHPPFCWSNVGKQGSIPAQDRFCPCPWLSRRRLRADPLSRPFSIRLGFQPDASVVPPPVHPQNPHRCHHWHREIDPRHPRDLASRQHSKDGDQRMHLHPPSHHAWRDQVIL